MNEQRKMQVLEEACDLALARMEQVVQEARRSSGLDNKNTELLKCLTGIVYKAYTTKAMMEGGEDGFSERSYADGMSGRRRRSRSTGRWYSGEDGGMSGEGMSNRSYDGGYSGHDQQQTIQKMRQLLEQMEQG